MLAMRIGVAACATSISDGTGLMIFSNFFPGKLVALIVAANNRVVEETLLLFLFANNKTLRDVLVDDDDVPQQTPLVKDDFAILNTACCALMYF